MPNTGKRFEWEVGVTSHTPPRPNPSGNYGRMIHHHHRKRGNFVKLEQRKQSMGLIKTAKICQRLRRAADPVSQSWPALQWQKGPRPASDVVRQQGIEQF